MVKNDKNDKNDLNNESTFREYFWQPPQTLPISRWAIINGVISGHSSATNETYKVFDGYNDLGQAIHCIALLARWNGGARTQLKKADEVFNEGAITANTRLSVAYLFDKDGGTFAVVNKIVDGTKTDIIYPTAIDQSLGNLPLGDNSIEGDDLELDTIQHFRVIDDINSQEFFDYGIILESNDIDARWEWMCTASNAELSSNLPTAIKND